MKKSFEMVWVEELLGDALSDVKVGGWKADKMLPERREVASHSKIIIVN